MSLVSFAAVAASAWTFKSAPLAVEPTTGREGSFRGLCARGGFVVDCAWKDGVPVRVSVVSKCGLDPDVRFRGNPVRDVVVRKLTSARELCYTTAVW